MKVFITGASGFVGTQLISFLTHIHGDSVVALSRSPASDEKIRKAGEEVPTKGWPPGVAKPSPGRVEIVRGDLSGKEALTQGMKGCDVVVHAAARVEMWGPYSLFQRDTVDGTRNVVEAAKAAGVPKFVHVGTEAVLVKAAGPIGHVDETAAVDPPPWAPYSRSKAAAEKIVLDANSPPKFESISVRPRFIWGRGDTVLKPMLAEAMDSGSFKWFTPPPQSSTCHVINVCHALRLAAASKGKGGQAYFATDGPPRDINAFLADYVCSQPGAKKPTGTMPLWLIWGLETALESLPFLGYGVTRKPLASRQALALLGHDVIVDDSKIRRELGYVPLVTVEEGLEDAK